MSAKTVKLLDEINILYSTIKELKAKIEDDRVQVALNSGAIDDKDMQLAKLRAHIIELEKMIIQAVPIMVSHGFWKTDPPEEQK